MDPVAPPKDDNPGQDDPPIHNDPQEDNDTLPNNDSLQDEPPADVSPIQDTSPLPLSVPPLVANELTFPNEEAMKSGWKMRYPECSTIAEVVRLFRELPLNEGGTCTCLYLLSPSSLSLSFSSLSRSGEGWVDDHALMTNFSMKLIFPAFFHLLQIFG